MYKCIRLWESDFTSCAETKRHVKKRTAWIEGWDLSEKGKSARRHMKENTLFRKKIRPANDQDIDVFYNHNRSRETTTSM